MEQKPPTPADDPALVAAFEARIAAGGSIEPKDWMPERYRKQLIRMMSQHAHSEVVGLIPCRAGTASAEVHTGARAEHASEQREPSNAPSNGTPMRSRMPVLRSLHRLRAPAFFLGASLAIISGCEGSVDLPGVLVPTPNIQITVVSGNNQNVPAGGEIPEPVVVRVMRDGVPYANRSVTFDLVQSGRLTLLSHAPTDAEGVASIRGTVSAALGPFSLRVYYLHCPRPRIVGDCGSPIVLLGAVTVFGTVVPATP